MMDSVTLLASKAVFLLESGAELEAVYPMLVKLAPLQRDLYGKHPGPQILLRNYEIGGEVFWHLWTTLPEADFTHEATWSANNGLSSGERNELSNHMLAILKQWVAEDALFADPMLKQDVVRILGLNTTSIDAGLKTLSRQIKNGQFRAIVLDKNFIRPLKADLPKF